MDMTGNRAPQDDDNIAHRVERDAAAEVDRVTTVQDDLVETVEDLIEHPPELGYLQAELANLRNAARGLDASDDPELP